MKYLPEGVIVNETKNYTSPSIDYKRSTNPPKPPLSEGYLNMCKY